MDFIQQIKAFKPDNAQEQQDQRIIIKYVEQYPHNILLRDNEFAHITSSGFIMNEALDKVLMIHHNIMGIWAWTGGHVDGDSDFLRVAIKEAKEETGIVNVYPLVENITSLDVLPVYGHMKNGKYVSAHLHLSISYILITSEKEALRINEAENSGVCWFSLDRFAKDHFGENDVYLYNKLIQRAKQISLETTTKRRIQV